MGWFAEVGGNGAAALPDGVVAAGETVLYAHWIPYELGINPESADGEPVVTYAPDLLGERVYKKLGKKNLDDPN